MGDSVGASASAVMGLCLCIVQDHALNFARPTPQVLMLPCDCINPRLPSTLQSGWVEPIGGAVKKVEAKDRKSGAESLPPLPPMSSLPGHCLSAERVIAIALPVCLSPSRSRQDTPSAHT